MAGAAAQYVIGGPIGTCGLKDGQGWQEYNLDCMWAVKHELNLWANTQTHTAVTVPCTQHRLIQYCHACMRLTHRILKHAPIADGTILKSAQ